MRKELQESLDAILALLNDVSPMEQLELLDDVIAIAGDRIFILSDSSTRDPSFDDALCSGRMQAASYIVGSLLVEFPDIEDRWAEERK